MKLRVQKSIRRYMIYESLVNGNAVSKCITSNSSKGQERADNSDESDESTR